MSDLKDLYQQVILDHNKNPRNFFKLENPDHQAEGYNPLCGDHLNVYLQLNGEKIQEVSFEGSGCAISKASGSMMTANVKGKTISEVNELFEKFHTMLTGEPNSTPPEGLDKLEVFSGVCEFPSRVKCATLAWHTLKSALDGRQEIVSTEKEEVENGK